MDCGFDTELVKITDDDRRNQKHYYEQLFLGEYKDAMECLYTDWMKKLATFSHIDAERLLSAMTFLQEVVATAMWKYDIKVNNEFDRFARDFDRLDIPSERIRLYQFAISKFDKVEKNK